MLFDETNNRRLIQIDLNEVDMANEALEDFFDALIAEERKDDEKISLEELTRILKADGKL